MDFGFTEEQERLRKEIHDFYINELPADCKTGYGMGGVTKEQQSFWMALQKRAGEKGYLTPGWRKEYGGSGLGPIEQGIINEEESYAGVSWPSQLALHYLGPALILFGTEEQRKELIPPITRGNVVCFQAFTEPDAGSDEANIQLRAVEDGDYYILNGQKAFINGSFKPDYLYAEARTADTIPKHRGLSLFVVPADTPGITYRPLPTMSPHMTNEIFFDDVRVPKKYLLGQLNRGFYHAMQTFEFERSGTAYPTESRRILREFVQFCKEEKRNGRPLIEAPDIRKELAQMAVEMEVWRLTAWDTVWWFSQRERLGPKSYDLSGFYWKIFPAKHADVMMRIMGMYGQLKEGSKWAELAGEVEHRWQAGRSTHAGGTIEIMRIVLAQRGLGLPRIPAQLMTEIGKAVRPSSVKT